MQMCWRMYGMVIVIVAAIGGAARADVTWIGIPRTQWTGTLEAEVPALAVRTPASVALPARDAAPLVAVSGDRQPPGLYAVRLTVRPSHVADAIAFNAGLRVHADDGVVATYAGHDFVRTHQPETRVVQLVHRRAGPLQVRLEAFADAGIADAAWIATELDQGGPTLGASIESFVDSGAFPDLDLGLSLSPDRAVYFLIDRVEFRPLSRSGRVTRLEIDRIRYAPGATLKGRVAVEDMTGKGGQGELRLYLEHGPGERAPAAVIPVALGPAPRDLDFEIALPERELGYALVAEYVSADGVDRAGMADYFTIAGNFQRVAIFGGGLATRDIIMDDEEPVRGELARARAEYFNAVEFFSWAEDDLAEMSPDADFWSSGQTNYRMHKQTIQRQIQLAQEQGFAVSTYGKQVMSGLPGWELVYDYPNDHRGQYNYHVGMWAGVDVRHLDRRRDRDFASYSRLPHVPGNPFRTWWSDFMPVGCDLTPQRVRMAAEEVIRSIDMFGWDAIRWDDHFRGPHWTQVGRAGNYQAWAARRTQSAMRFFKTLVAERYPEFRHGYNYLLIEQDKGYDWAREDFELDELCRDGGLIMNESIGNASGGWTFGQIARNLQVEGDLVRERGGYYLGISFAQSPRDRIIESALWAAAGCRPYNTAMTREVRRYCTRYAQYTFDENLRRLARPEAVLAPVEDTAVWWQPFVYETPLDGQRRQLVVNLLNLPLDDRRPPRDGQAPPRWNMPPGTAPVAFALNLPDGLRATRVRHIDPFTLAVEPLALRDQRFEAPAVTAWQVVVIDLDVDEGAPSLGERYGPPRTFGVPRPDLSDDDRRPDVVLDPSLDDDELRRQFAALAPEWEVKDADARVALDALDGPARERALRARRAAPETLAEQWWKGAGIPADLALKENRPVFGDLTPRRNGRFDIFYGRGAMDYRLGMPRAFARLERFAYHDKPFSGAVREGTGGAWLNDNVPGTRYADFDLLLFTGIPHNAIGIENSYALADYVKAGGAVFFTGGEYAFGKGGYMHTVLERELLPFLCTGMQDTAYTIEPREIAPGPDVADLQVALDFSTRPAFWVRNEVVLKPGAKVFLQSGDGAPVLVGWTVGNGRVVCLLLDHRGRSDDQATAFFDWPDWPRLIKAVLEWAAPAAGTQDAVTARATDGEVQAILDGLEGAGMDDLLDGLDSFGSGTDLLGDTTTRDATELSEAALRERLSLIDRALTIGDGAMASALAGQLVAVANLPLRTRLAIFARLRDAQPAAAGRLGTEAMRNRHSVVRGSGYALLAASGDPAFARQLAAPGELMGELAAHRQARLRDLAVAVALYPNADLVAEGRRRVADWNREEQTAREAFAPRCGDDALLLETSPFLDADAILARFAWLAYLAHHAPDTYGPQFLHEWVRASQYIAYCGRTAAYLIAQDKLTGARADAVRAAWRDLSARFAALQNLTRSGVEALVTADPEAAGAALAKARFSPEVRTVINLLGGHDRHASRTLLTSLLRAGNADLAAFAAARLADD